MRKVAILSLSIMMSTQALAWRETGHYSVCEIGYQLASEKTKKILNTIFEDQTFAVNCTWPDHVRKTDQYKYSYPMHFINIDDGEDYYKNIDKKGDALQAILKYSDYLRSQRKVLLAKSIKLGKNSREIRESLKFLGHFVGDIHQPLHVGRGSDHGGNKIKVKWDQKESYTYNEFKLIDGGHISVETSKKPVNLHKCIDQHIFEKFISENMLKPDSTGTAYKAYTVLLLKGKIKFVPRLQSENLKKWLTGTPESWMQESLKQRTAIYNVESKQNLSGTYYKNIMSSIHLRVLQAGVRLANILDRAFDVEDQLTKDEVDLRERISKALNK